MAYPVARSIAVMLRGLLRYAERSRKHRFMDNIAHFMPGRDDYEALYDANIDHFAKYIVEEIHMRWINPRRIRDGCEFVNPEVLDAHVNAGEKVLVTAAHQGNLDWVWLALCLRYPQADMAMVGRSLRIDWGDRILNGMRERFGKQQMLDHEFARQMLKRPQVPDMLCFVTDLTPVSKGLSGTITPFLGHPVVFYNTLPRVAARFSLPIVFLRAERLGYGRFRVTFRDLYPAPTIEEADNVQLAYVEAVEESVRADPAGWMFWRWVGWWRRRETPPENPDAQSHAEPGA